jgi:hypothetical protein
MIKELSKTTYGISDFEEDDYLHTDKSTNLFYYGVDDESSVSDDNNEQTTDENINFEPVEMIPTFSNVTIMDKYDSSKFK